MGMAHPLPAGAGGLGGGQRTRLAHAWVLSNHYKTRRSHGVALSAAAVELLRSLPQTGSAVFGHRGKPVTGPFHTKAFRKARARDGLPGVRWHVLRHTFASWLAYRGALDRVLQAMGGWASRKMAARYRHLRSEELRPWADAVGTFAGTALKTAMQPAQKKSK
jgi:integrase